jgi:cell division protein FtsB
VSVAVAELILVGPMKAMLPLSFLVIIFSTIVLSSGCQKKTAATNSNSQSETELRDNTKPLQAADLVGYDGTKLRKSVDQIREANEKHNQEVEKMVETGPDQ